VDVLGDIARVGDGDVVGDREAVVDALEDGVMLLLLVIVEVLLRSVELPLGEAEILGLREVESEAVLLSVAVSAAVPVWDELAPRLNVIVPVRVVDGVPVDDTVLVAVRVPVGVEATLRVRDGVFGGVTDGVAVIEGVTGFDGVYVGVGLLEGVLEGEGELLGVFDAVDE
jgi:hypothetical protein